MRASTLLLSAALACTEARDSSPADRGDESGSPASSDSDAAGDTAAIVSDTGVPSGEDPNAEPDPDVRTWIPPELRPAAPIRLVLLGDSITAGSGASRPTSAYANLLQENDAERWPGYDDVDLASAFPTITEVIDVSQGGAVTQNLLSQQIPALKRRLGTLPATGETIVVFTIGGNDAQMALLPGSNATRIVDDALANMEAIIQALQDPEVFETPPAIYATNIYEPTDGVGSSRGCFLNLDFSRKLPQLDRYDAAFQELAETYRFAAVDLHGHFRGHGFHHADQANPYFDAEDSSLWFYGDCIHPNDRGHHELRRLFWHAIQGLPLPTTTP